MTSLPETPHGPDLDALRKEIDDLKNTPEEELISRPLLGEDDDRIATPEPTDAIGSEDWDRPAEDAVPIQAEGPDED